MKPRTWIVTAGLITGAAGAPAQDTAVDIGSRRELFIDGFLVSETAGLRHVVHRPVEQGAAIVHDAPWEGSNCLYHTVFRDGDRFRMYYRGSQLDWQGGKVTYPHGQVICYAESTDGIEWTKPNLGIVSFNGSTDNNIILAEGPGSHNFSPFKDTNPDCPPDQRYKALAGLKGLLAFASPDGIHWTQLKDEAVITKGAFDSQNLAFWDPVRNEYRDYHRGFREGRDVMTCTSKDFVNWTEPQWLEYVPGRLTELYTNQIMPYPRAPHLLIGLPTRYIAGRDMLTPINRAIAEVSRRFGTDYSDTGLISSRDRQTFNVWGEAFIRPGPTQKGRWIYGDNYAAWGMLVTTSAIEGAPDELSFYASEGTWRGSSMVMRRYTLRLDGFASLQAPYEGGKLLTRPVVFSGSQLFLNMSTSAAGSVRVEIQHADGTPVPGFELENCPDIFGDAIDREVVWTGNPDLGNVAGKPVRLRVVMKDADLYALQFR